MKYKNIIIYIFFITNHLNCTSHNNNSLYSLNPIDKIEIPIDNNTPNLSKSIYIFDNDKDKIEYLCYLNENTNEINFYNLNTNKLSHKIKFEKEGKNGTNTIGGFHIISLDSIVIVNRAQNQIFLTNKRGEVVKRITIGLKKDNNFIKNGKTLVRISRSYSHIYNPLVVKDNKIYASTFIPYVPTQSEMTNLNLCLEINMDNNQQQLLKANYPLLLGENKKTVAHTMNTRTFSGNSFVYSFFSSHDIFVTNNHNKIIKYNAKSKFLRDELRCISFNGQHMKDYVEAPHYDAIMYDKYRNVYYRFVYPGKELTDNDNIQKLAMYCEDFSIMLLNKDFEVIGEQLLPPNTYYMNMAFVSKKGLCISTQHPQNPNLNENYLTFQVFSIKDNKK